MAGREAITPELVLVDPELRRRVLDVALSDLFHETIYAASTTNVDSLPRKSTPSITTAQRAHRTRFRPAAELAALTTIAALVIALPCLAFLPPRQQPSLVERETASPSARSRITWDADPAADYYVVEFVIHGRLVAVRTPSAPAVSVPPAVSRGARWRTFAGYGPIAARNTRGPIASGTTVAAS